MLAIFNDKVVKLLSWICIILITGLTLIVFIQVVSRYIELPLAGTEELARFMVIWLTFFGSSLAIHEKIHLGVDFFVGLAKEKHQKIIQIGIHLLIIVFFSILAIYGTNLTILSMGTSSSALQLPMGLVYSAIPISSITSIYFLIINILEISKKGVTTSQ